VQVEHLALRTAAWSELHAWLAAAARTGAALEPAELDAAARAYAVALERDEADELLGRTTRTLAACTDEACARRAVAGAPFESPFAAALPVFLGQPWAERAALARSGVEAARVTLGAVEGEVLLRRVRTDLAFADEEETLVVDVVADAPPAGREAPIRASLAARGSCFVREKNESARIEDARIVDCVLAYALLAASRRSELHDALVAELGAREGETAWSLVVVHAVAAVVTAWEARHVSVLRRSALAVRREDMEWLAREWPARMRGEPAASFARRFAAAMKAPR